MARGNLCSDSDGSDEERTAPERVGNQTVSIERVTCLRSSKLAILVRLGRASGRDTFWIPQSIIDVDSEVYAEGHSGRLVIRAWWARKEGIL